MRTVAKVAQRVVMFYPRARLNDDEAQVLYDGPTEQMEQCTDERVIQFIRGEARERLIELRGEAEHDTLA
jgi:phospholipid/cholesterol/gamma-HCH transport system ATP-binding protein